MPERFPNKRIAITGAGSGLGRAIALRFARDGWRIAVTDVDAGRAGRVIEEVRSAGGDGFSLSVDVRAIDDLHRLAAALEEQFSGVDVVVNNAGVANAGTVIDTPLEDWDWILDINLMGVVRGCHVLAPLLVRQGHGHVVNIASFAAIASAPAVAAYNTAKAGVVAVSETLRAELARTGVGVSVACPSFFRTNLLDSFRSTDPKLRSFAERMFAQARLGADDVAEDIYRAVHAKRFLVITHGDARWLYRLKRFAPESFYRLVVKQAGGVVDTGDIR